MQNTLSDATSTAFDKAVVASYSNHSEPETAAWRLATGDLPINEVSLIGRNFETYEEIQGFYRPRDAVLEGAKQGAWFGGFFGLILGAMGFFIFPIVSDLPIGGALTGFVAGASGGAGVVALINGLVTMEVRTRQCGRMKSFIAPYQLIVRHI